LQNKATNIFLTPNPTPENKKQKHFRERGAPVIASALCEAISNPNNKIASSQKTLLAMTAQEKILTQKNQFPLS